VRDFGGEQHGEALEVVVVLGGVAGEGSLALDRCCLDAEERQSDEQRERDGRPPV
jgi:hypothetical protein